MQINSNIWSLKSISGRNQRSNQTCFIQRFANFCMNYTEGHSWSSQQLSWMWNYDYLIRMNKGYVILPMLHYCIGEVYCMQLQLLRT